jgi:AcrR family transcriptional regulator
MERRQQQKEATAQRIFAAAAELFVRNGYHETTVEQICAAAGVAKGTFFVHFKSKAAVLDDLGRMQMARVMLALSEQPGFAAQPFRAQVLLIFSALGELVSTQRALVLLTAVELLTRPGGTTAGMQSVPDFDALLTELAAQAQRRGELRADLAADVLARTVRNVYFAAIFDWLPQTTLSFIAVATSALDLALDGMTSSRRTT